MTTPTEGRGVSYVSSFSHLGLTAACGIFDFDCNQVMLSLSRQTLKFHFSLLQVRLYDLNSGAFKQSFKGHRGKINCVEFESKDFGMGTKIVSGGNDKRYRMGMRIVSGSNDKKYGMGMRIVSESNKKKYGMGMRIVSGGNDKKY